MSEQDIMLAHPTIQWRTPVITRMLGDHDQRLACRLCIAMKGLKASEIKELPRTREDFAKHMAFTHKLVAIFTT